jgi:hypothetical protein
MSYTGWKYWLASVDQDGPILLSHTMVKTRWTGPHLRADIASTCESCARARDAGFDPLMLGMGCAGIYAFTEPYFFSRYGIFNLSLVSPTGGAASGVVFGRVQLYGSVAIHEVGYRATDALIMALVMAPHQQPGMIASETMLPYFERRYQCEVVIHTGAPSCRCEYCQRKPLFMPESESTNV